VILTLSSKRKKRLSNKEINAADQLIAQVDASIDGLIATQAELEDSVLEQHLVNQLFLAFITHRGLQSEFDEFSKTSVAQETISQVLKTLERGK
jgi:hypothetical protein